VKDERIQLRVSEKEKLYLNRLATKHDMTLSEYMRSILLRDFIKEADTMKKVEKYVLIETGKGNEEVEFFDSMDDAIYQANWRWDRLDKHSKKDYTFTVGSTDDDYESGDLKEVYLVLSNEGKSYRTIYDFTQQESGIVLYNSREVIVANWLSFCSEGGRPILSPLGTIIPWNEDDLLTVTREWESDDIREDLTGEIYEEDILEKMTELKVLYDYNNDLETVINEETPGTCYELKDGTIIIAPKGWN